MKIKSCRNCKSKKLIKIFSLGNINYTGKFLKKNINSRIGPINTVMCKKCNLVQLHNNFDLKYLYGPDYGYRTGINATMTEHVKNITKIISKKANVKKNDWVLDIASNDATLLNFYRRELVTFGIDPLVNKFKKNYKDVNFKISNFFSANKIKKKLSGNKFKIITALSVFYDLQDPNSFLKGTESILSDDGILLLEFADLASIIRFNMFDTFCHEHLEYYSSKVIQEMAAKNNLRIFDVKQNNINGGSIQFYICKKNAIYKNNLTALKKINKIDRKYKLDKVVTYQKFIKKVDGIKYNLIKFIKKAKANNKTIHGYGASTKGNVLLQYFGLTNKEITYIAERNPKKYNLYTPGTKIKIISEKDSRRMNPDYYLVLPWHFKKEIIKREKKDFKNKSKFIFPLPNLKIY